MNIATPLSPIATTAMLLGSGELGKEVVIELQRLGVETIAVDRYPNAPAMQVAHRSHVIDMLDSEALAALLHDEAPDLVIPEVEAINTDVLAAYESEGRVIPTARATQLTMDREGIRRLAAETLGLPTSPYQFVDDVEALRDAVDKVGVPCVIKPVMSSSGKGQSVIHSAADIDNAWNYAQQGARGGHGERMRCIVEGFVKFDREWTLLTVRHAAGVTFFEPIRHEQVNGDYAASWQGEAMSDAARANAEHIATTITDALGGYGIYGVELFQVGDEMLFSEVSPRPHDTGLVTLGSQDVSEFAAHARAVLRLPVASPERFPGAAASIPLKVKGKGVPSFEGLERAYAIDPSVQVRLFGKPYVDGERRVAVVIARGQTVDAARARAQAAADAIDVTLVDLPESA